MSIHNPAGVPDSGNLTTTGDPAHPLGEAAGYAAAWPDRAEERRKFGLMLGALKGLKYQVDDSTRLKIEKIIQEVEAQPHIDKITYRERSERLGESDCSTSEKPVKHEK